MTSQTFRTIPSLAILMIAPWLPSVAGAKASAYNTITNAISRKRFLCYFPLLFTLIFSGCQNFALTYNQSDIPRTPPSLRQVIKQGTFVLDIDDALMKETRKHRGTTWATGNSTISYNPGEYLEQVGTIILKEVTHPEAALSNIKYTYRIKDMHFYFAAKDTEVSKGNGNFYCYASIDIEVTTSDGKTLINTTITGKERVYFDTGSAKSDTMEQCMSVALCQALHEVICESIEEIAKKLI